MTTPESFAAIVDTLVSVRRDYHEKLKSIPQYEAFLLIEDSTNKAADALHGTEASGSSIATDVIDSLQYARTRFEQHMTSIPPYRVLQAIDKVIKEISQHLGLTAQDDAAAPPSATAAVDPAEVETAVNADADQETASAEPVAAAAEVEVESEAQQDASEDEPVGAEVAEEPAAEAAESEAEVEVQVEAEAPALRVVEAKAPSIVPADAEAEAGHDDDIVVLNAPAWEKSGKDAKDDITARLAAKAASAALEQADESHDEADDLVVVSKREASDHEAA
ncbi:hypothetical protein BRADO3848 [Bradyrhizobium sp. ORS 278]|uniref:hypothetical protein n=1 Tax=Bradyrhizobium sp. (strain ORS 278) TaxID=114615 RepID=UPI000150887F|nr:hypothetical protein [Bradyrhizobium sp. ORS 278]CAL77613.1 hypothetical protein BRADO3848 [Bradyrhizobium sp. ORS 278]